MAAKKITHNGKTLKISEWSKEIGVSVLVLTYRINKGWPLEKVFGLKPTRHNSVSRCNPRKKKDVVGKRFGRVVVTRYVKDGVYGIKNLRKLKIVEVTCDCGEKRLALYQSLSGSGVRSCGCYVTERMREYNKQRKLQKRSNEL
jgi:hypothetical protein